MDDIKRRVREGYGEIARKAGASCCGSSCCGDSSAEAIGYSRAEIEAAPQGADMGLGCGNPTAIADLKPGETVLDLGSGGGFDCFLAANAVGSGGRVIGVDMTKDMVTVARANAEKAGYANVEFRLGEIEELPVENASVDVVISNCVINLVPSKQQAFAEAARVLKPGGRLHVSDIVVNGEIPAAFSGSIEAYVGCVAGAVSRETYLTAMEAGGLVDIEIESEKDASQLLAACWPVDTECGCASPQEMIEGLVSSITVSARKPL
jgi:SAM-dependent methyltransferase